ncbi:MAG: hypothetical protein ACTSV2_02080 [Candidatus Thorarchaeota archaeon]
MDSQRPRHFMERIRRTQRPFTLLVIVLLLVSSGLILAIFPQYFEVTEELIGTTSIESWIPVHMMYDPPGNGSSSTVSLNGSGIMRARFEGITPGREVIGEYIGSMISGTYGTPDQARSHAVVAVELNQTWEVWRLARWGAEWIEARLIDYQNFGIGLLSQTDIENRSMWVEDLTGTSSLFQKDWSIEQGETVEATYISSMIGFYRARAGYEINLFGYDFNISVWLDLGGYSLVTSYVFHGSDGPLEVSLLSNSPITRISEERYSTERVLLWFSE